VTLVLPSPVTVAKNRCVLAVPVDGATKAYAGEMATLTVPTWLLMVMIAAPLRDGSAWLVAVSTTGFVAGAEAGAR
jgi:hypothetical protein